MSTESKSHHTRADSGVDSMKPIPKKFDSLKNLWEAMSSLANGEDFETLGDLIKHVSIQEERLWKKEEEVRELNKRLTAHEESHEAYNQEQLSHFEERYRQWQETNSALKSEAKHLATASDEKDKQMVELHKELTVNKDRVVDLDKAHNEVTKRLKDKDRKLGELDTRLSDAQTEISDYAEKLKQAEEHTAAQKKLLEDETRSRKSLQDEAEKMRGKLKEFQQFSVRMKELDLPEMASQLEFLWRAVTTLIGSFLGRDLSVEVLQSDWTKLRENEVFKHHIPLPQSNSDIAKQMRVAIVLGSLATLTDKLLFQPNHLLEEGSGLRGVLRKEATINAKKEMYTRGILLSMSPKDQEKFSEESVEFVVEDLLEVVNVRVLLAPDSLPTFEGALKDLMSHFQKQWTLIQHGRQKLEPSFAAHPTTTDIPWHVLDFKAAVEDRNRPSAPLTTTNAQDGTVVIPRVYHIKPETIPDPITHGCVLQRAHMDAAAEEIRKGLPRTPFTEGTLSRSRNRPGRSLSMSANGTLNGHRGGHLVS